MAVTTDGGTIPFPPLFVPLISAAAMFGGVWSVMYLTTGDPYYFLSVNLMELQYGYIVSLFIGTYLAILYGISLLRG